MIRKRHMVVVWAALATQTLLAQLPLSVDTTFRASMIYAEAIGGLHILSNGQLLVSGQMHFPGAPVQIRTLAILNADGSWEQNPQIGAAGGGSIYPWASSFYVAATLGFNRILPGWQLDYGFHQSYFRQPIFGGTHCHPYTDSTLLIGGKSRIRSRVDSSFYPEEYCLVKLDKDGEPDTTFHHRVCDFGGHTDLIEPLPDGRFLISGHLQGYYEGQLVGDIFRIWPDGSLDTTFQCSMFWGRAWRIQQQPGGKLLVNGVFKIHEAPDDTLGLMRLHADGSLDTTFNYGHRGHGWPWYTFPGLAGFGRPYQVDPNRWWVPTAQILNGSLNPSRLMAIDSLGNILPNDPILQSRPDTAFFWGGSPATAGYGGFYESPDGSIYLIGFFEGYHDIYGTFYPDQRYIVKLHGLNVGVEEALDECSLAVYPNPGHDQLNISLPFLMHHGTFRVHDQQGRLIHERSVKRNSIGMLRFQAETLAPGLYTMLMITDQGEKWSAKWLKR